MMAHFGILLASFETFDLIIEEQVLVPSERSIPQTIA